MSRSFAYALPLALLLLVAPDADAQRRGFGIGAQIGLGDYNVPPTGLSLKIPVGRRSLDAGIGFDDDVFYLQSHLLLDERAFQGTGGDLGYFYGPGAFLAASDSDAAFGLSFNGGVAFYAGPAEIYGQFTPLLLLSPDTDFEVGGAIGVRFYP